MKLNMRSTYTPLFGIALFALASCGPAKSERTKAALALDLRADDSFTVETTVKVRSKSERLDLHMDVVMRTWITVTGLEADGTARFQGYFEFMKANVKARATNPRTQRESKLEYDFTWNEEDKPSDIPEEAGALRQTIQESLRGTIDSKGWVTSKSWLFLQDSSMTFLPPLAIGLFSSIPNGEVSIGDSWSAEGKYSAEYGGQWAFANTLSKIEGDIATVTSTHTSDPPGAFVSFSVKGKGTTVFDLKRRLPLRATAAYEVEMKGDQGKGTITYEVISSVRSH